MEVRSRINHTSNFHQILEITYFCAAFPARQPVAPCIQPCRFQHFARGQPSPGPKTFRTVFMRRSVKIQSAGQVSTILHSCMDFN